MKSGGTGSGGGADGGGSVDVVAGESVEAVVDAAADARPASAPSVLAESSEGAVGWNIPGQDQPAGLGSGAGAGVGVIAQTLAVIEQQVQALQGARVWAMSDAQSRHAVEAVYGLKHRLEAAALGLVRDLDGRPEAVERAKPGAVAKTFLDMRLHRGPARAGNDVKAAHMLDPGRAAAEGGFPRCARALAEGVISREHVDVIVRVRTKIPGRLMQAPVVGGVLYPDGVPADVAEAAAAEADAADADAAQAAATATADADADGDADADADTEDDTAVEAAGTKGARVDRAGADGNGADADADANGKGADGEVRCGADLVDVLLVDFCSRYSPKDTEHLARHLLNTLDPEGSERFDAEAFERRTASVVKDSTGMWRITGQLHDADGIPLKTLIMALSKPFDAYDAEDEDGVLTRISDTRTAGQRTADALGLMARLAMGAYEKRARGGEPAHVAVTATAAQIADILGDHPTTNSPTTTDAASRNGNSGGSGNGNGGNGGNGNGNGGSGSGGGGSASESEECTCGAETTNPDTGPGQATAAPGTEEDDARKDKHEAPADDDDDEDVADDDEDVADEDEDEDSIDANEDSAGADTAEVTPAVSRPGSPTAADFTRARSHLPPTTGTSGPGSPGSPGRPGSPGSPGGLGRGHGKPEHREHERSCRRHPSHPRTTDHQPDQKPQQQPDQKPQQQPDQQPQQQPEQQPGRQRGRPPNDPGLAEVQYAGSISRATLAQLLCDCTLQRVLLAPNGASLSLGREERTANRAQRRALIARDRGCVVPGCDAPAEWCEAHHVVWFRNGGLTDVEGMALVCGRHHTMIHLGIWELVMREGIPWARPPAWLDPDRRWIRNRWRQDRDRAHDLGLQLRLDTDDTG